MTARGGWLWPVPPRLEPPGGDGGGRGLEGTAQQAQGRAYQSDIRQQCGGVILHPTDSSHHLCSLKLVTDLCEVTVKKHGNSLGISGRCRVESWLSH